MFLSSSLEVWVLKEGLTAWLTAYVGEVLGLIKEPLHLRMSESRLKALDVDAGRAPIIRPFRKTQDIADRCFQAPASSLLSLPLLMKKVQKPPVVFAMAADLCGGPEVIARDFLGRLARGHAFAAAGLPDWARHLSEACGDNPQAGPFAFCLLLMGGRLTI